VPDSLSHPRLAQFAVQSMDDKLTDLATAVETMGGNGVVEITTSSVEAVCFIEGRMLALGIPGYVRLVQGTT
jgi:hypothetical protein